MGTYTVAPLTGVPPSGVGQIALDPATETGTADGFAADAVTDRVFIPGGARLTAITFDLTLASVGLGGAQSKVSMQLPSSTVTFIHDRTWPDGTSSISHVVADDAGLAFGSFPYRVPVGGVYLFVEFDANSPGNVTSGLVTIVYDFGRKRWVGTVGRS